MRAPCSPRRRVRSARTKRATSSKTALAEHGRRLLITVVDQIAAGTAREEPQDDSAGDLCAAANEGRRPDRLVAIRRWQIHNRVRGLYPWPHAYTFFNGARLIVLRIGGRQIGRAGSSDTFPGTILEVTPRSDPRRYR